MFKQFIKVLTFVSLVLVTHLAYSKENYALLVGVSEYPNLDPSLSLAGPVNDIVAMRAVLLEQSFPESNILVLADGMTHHGMPTKANIMAGLEEIAKVVKPGDFVYLHFSGHGSQQPSDDFRTEADGLDEIFLPRDVRNWDMETDTVPNALTDDEVGEKLDAIRARGANVWLVFDSCHSGTMSRSVTDGTVKMRSVKPSDIGVPIPVSTSIQPPKKKPSQAKPAIQIETDEGSATRGSLVAFYAAQTNEEAPEMDLPQGEQRVPQGLFSFTLSRLISRFPDASYKQLAQMILASYNGMPWFRTTPLFEGNAMEQAIFHREGGADTRFAVRVDREGAQLQAGVLHGFDRGAQVALYTMPGGGEAVDIVEVTHSELTQSRLAAQNELKMGTYYAELAQPAFPPPLRVKWLQSPSNDWLVAQKSLKNNELLNRTVTWVSHDEAAEVSLYAGKKALYLFTAQDQLPCELPISDAQNCAPAGVKHKQRPLPQSGRQYASLLSSTLSRAVRALNLMRLSDSMLGTDGVSSYAYHKVPGKDFEPITLESGLTLADGDELLVEFVNTTEGALDVTILFIDSLFGITQIYPEPGTSGRLLAGEMTDFEGVINASTIGTEQFMIIATPVSRDDTPTSLLHLQQPSLDSGVFSRGAKGHDLFAQALGDAPQSRGFNKSTQSSQSTISVIRWRTVAK